MRRRATEAPPPNTDRRVLRTRAAVLAAGTALFHELGARAITVEEVSRRTGIAKTTIYRHWRSREDLVIAILEQVAVAVPATSTDDPLHDIRTILLAVWAGLVEPSSRMELAGTIEAMAASPQLASEHRRFLTARTAPLVDAVERAIASGAVEASAGAQTLADLLVSPIVVRALIRGDEPDPRYVDRLAGVVLDSPTSHTDAGASAGTKRSTAERGGVGVRRSARTPTGRGT